MVVVRLETTQRAGSKTPSTCQSHRSGETRSRDDGRQDCMAAVRGGKASQHRQNSFHEAKEKQRSRKETPFERADRSLFDESTVSWPVRGPTRSPIYRIKSPVLWRYYACRGSGVRDQIITLRFLARLDGAKQAIWEQQKRVGVFPLPW